MITVTLHTQYPARTVNPTVPSVVVLEQNGLKQVIGRFPTLGNARQNWKSLVKALGIDPATVICTEDSVHPCHDHEHMAVAATVGDVVGKALSVARRFELMGLAVNLVLEKELPSVIIVGQGGLGKSFTVGEEIRKANLLEVDANVAEPLDGGNTDMVVFVKGAITKQSLYKVLHNYRFCTIVFDDADAILADEDRVNMLKAVLDSTVNRRVSWISAALAQEGFDTTFTFEGQIIYISNRRVENMPQTLQSRSLMIDLTLSQREVFDRIREIGKKVGYGLTHAEIDYVVDTLWDRRDTLKEVSMRTMIKAAAFFRKRRADFEDLVSFAL